MTGAVDADVVVVGGGPAGSATAALVARGGHRVVQLEREHHPRHQAGGSLLPATIRRLGALMGVRDLLAGADFVRAGDGLLHWGPDGEHRSFPPRPGRRAGEPTVLHTPRAELDAMLFEHARRCGVDARDGVEALSSLKDRDGRVTGVTGRDRAGRSFDVHARFVVDASGRAGAFATLAGRRIRSRFFRNVGVYGYFEGAAADEAVDRSRSLTVGFEHGWCWMTPLGARLTMVGAVVDDRHVAAIEHNPPAALEAFADACPVIAQRLAGTRHATASMYAGVRVSKDWAYGNAACWAPGLLLVGDAAGFMDPVLPTGVHLATSSGVLAALAINSAIEGTVGERQAMEEFARRFRYEFRLFYELLIAFYAMPGNWDSFYWSARTPLANPERGNTEFIELVLGEHASPEAFMLGHAGAGPALAHLLRDTGPVPDEDGAIARAIARMLALDDAPSPDPDPHPDALRASADGLRWEPVSARGAARR